eukprot:scaffold218651_cov30-Tisochrysis_lutea.AAC.4
MGCPPRGCDLTTSTAFTGISLALTRNHRSEFTPPNSRDVCEGRPRAIQLFLQTDKALFWRLGAASATACEWLTWGRLRMVPEAGPRGTEGC